MVVFHEKLLVLVIPHMVFSQDADALKLLVN